MANRLTTHNRFHAEDLESMPSQLDELTLHSRLEQPEQRSKGWLRNVAIGALVVLVAAAMFLAR